MKNLFVLLVFLMISFSVQASFCGNDKIAKLAVTTEEAEELAEEDQLATQEEIEEEENFEDDLNTEDSLLRDKLES